MFRSLILSATLALAALATAPRAQAAAEPEIPYTRFQLPNGLTVIVHEDHKAPIVAVSVWYHVGSGNEPAGKTGFAHLFEHLMFQGSENHDGEFFGPFELVGATGMNGTTWLDRTNYFETVPSTALDMALWMESDRMGHLLGAIGQPQLDEQRGVVQNEKRQGENQPYGRAYTDLQANAFPANHPYHHDTIGSMDDLNAASLDTVKQWFKDYYGAANTTVVLAGDIDVATAKARMLKYFGDIPAGPRVEHPATWIAPRSESTRGVMTDNVSQVRIYREWNVPQLGSEDLPRLELAAAILGGGKTSRLYQRLVYQDKLVDDVSMRVMPFELASMALLQADVKQGVDPNKVEAAIAEVMDKFLAEGPTADELERAKSEYKARTIRSLERIGGFSGKAVTLAEGQVYLGDPDAWKKAYDATLAANADQVLAASKQWIAAGDYTLTVKPGKVETADASVGAGRPALDGKPKPTLAPAGEYRTVESGVDRSKGVPTVTEFPELSFPELQHATLDNGMAVVLAERHAVPVVHVSLQFDAGYAADQDRKLGTASFTMEMLDEGTAKLDSVEIAKRKERLGAGISSGCGLDTCHVSLNAIKDQLQSSMDLFADVIRDPAFREADMERIRSQWLAGIAQEKTRPTGLAFRILPPLLYGKDHAYGIPLTGSGTEDAITKLGATDLRRFMSDFIRPDNATILVAGDTTLAEILPRLNAAFADWKAPASEVPEKNLAKVDYPDATRVYLVDRPNAPQTLILAGLVAPSTKVDNNLAIETMNGAFGGTFTSRLNMNLREDKHWAYGARSLLLDAVGQRPFVMYAPVQTDQTVPSIQEVLKEATAVIGDKPLQAEEVQKIQDNDIRSLPGRYETASAVLGAMAEIELYDRPDDFVVSLQDRIENLSDKAVNQAAEEVIHPDKLTWVIVGDLETIEKPIRALDLGKVQVMDVDGKIID